MIIMLLSEQLAFCSHNKKIIDLGDVWIMVKVVFQSVFCLEMYQNNIFFKKNYY